jgi:hypothetical protein
MGWGISKLDFNVPANMPKTKNKMAGSVKLFMNCSGCSRALKNSFYGVKPAKVIRFMHPKKADNF